MNQIYISRQKYKYCGKRGAKEWKLLVNTIKLKKEEHIAYPKQKHWRSPCSWDSSREVLHRRPASSFWISQQIRRFHQLQTRAWHYQTPPSTRQRVQIAPILPAIAKLYSGAFFPTTHENQLSNAERRIEDEIREAAEEFHGSDFNSVAENDSEVLHGDGSSKGLTYLLQRISFPTNYTIVLLDHPQLLWVVRRMQPQSRELQP